MSLELVLQRLIMLQRGGLMGAILDSGKGYLWLTLTGPLTWWQITGCT